MPRILRTAFLTVALVCATSRGECATTFSSDASDMWWNPNESGWGINIVQQANVIFATLFVYGADGKAHWFVAPDTEAGSSLGTIAFNGALYETTGPVFSGSFNPAAVTVRQVGTLAFSYEPPANAQLTYSVDGVTVNKSIVRQTWRSPTLQGEYLLWRTLRSTNCTRMGSETEDLIVSQDGPSVSMQLRSGTSLVCQFTGMLQQNGRMATISGSSSCQGTMGTFLFNDMEIGVHGFTAHYEGTELNGCSLVGHVAGVVTTPP